jgi:hypothetical protein
MMRRYSILLLTIIVVCGSFVAGNFAMEDGVMVTGASSKVLRFYPNPATQYIQFEFDKSVDKTYTLEIYNFIGRKMSASILSTPRITIYFDDNYFRGLYVFQLRDISGRIVESGKFQIVR